MLARKEAMGWVNGGREGREGEGRAGQGVQPRQRAVGRVDNVFHARDS